MKMNKKGLVSLLLLGSMVPANATIARLQALGMNETDNEGSYYIEDNRNIFLNAANIVKYSNSLVVEWGAAGSNLVGSQLQTDKNYAPKAKGGFLKSNGDWTYGVYFGNESNTSALLRGVATAASAAVKKKMLYGSDNQLDIFFGKKASAFDWGVDLVYTHDKNDSAKSKDHGYAVKFGAKADRWDGFVNLSVGSNSKSTVDVTTGAINQAGMQQVTQEFAGKFGIHAGGSYEVQKGMKVYAFAKTFSWDQKDNGGKTQNIGTVNGVNQDGRGQLGTVKGGFTTYAVGMGKTYDFAGGKVFVNAEYRMKSINVKFANKAEAKNVYVPLTLGYEVKANSWLTLRGSVSQYLYGYRKNNNYSSLNAAGNGAAQSVFGADTSNKKQTISNSTVVNAGMSLTFGRLVIDGLIGTSGNNGQVTPNADGTDKKSGVFALDRLMSRVAATYSF